MAEFEDLPEGLNVGKEVNRVAGVPQVGDIYIGDSSDGLARMIVPSNWMERQESYSYDTRAGPDPPDFVGKKLDLGEDDVEEIMKGRGQRTLTGRSATPPFGAENDIRVSKNNVGNIWYFEVPMHSADIEGGGPNDSFIDKKRSGTWIRTSEGDVGTWLRIKEAAYLEKSYGQSSEYSSGRRSIYEELVGADEVLHPAHISPQPFVNFTENTEKKPVSKKSIAIAPKSTGIKMF